MIISNNDGESKLFIDEAIISNLVFSTTDNENLFNMHGTFDVIFTNTNMIVNRINTITYHKDEDKLTLIKDNEIILLKNIEYNKLINIEIGNDEKTIIIEEAQIPSFMYEKQFDETYPKVDVKISDCIYSMKIYVNENNDYIDIPDYQSHFKAIDTIHHISDVIEYLTIQNTDLMNNLVNGNTAKISIKSDNGEILENEYQYKLSDVGIALFGEEFENGVYIIEWQKLFRLLIDEKWTIEIK